MVESSANIHDTAAPALGFARRGLLSTAGAVFGAAAAGPPGASPVRTATAQPAAGVAGSEKKPPAAAQGTALDQECRRRALEVRVNSAKANAETPAPPHPNNGDEERYANKIGSDTRGLPHDGRGEVDPAAWRAAVAAYESGDPAEFEKIPLGGTRKQQGRIGALAVNLIGLDATQLATPPAPALASAARAAEAVELYWQSLLRDVPFAAYPGDTSHPDLLAAVDELNRLVEFNGPKADGRVTPQTLFRGSAFYVDRSDPSSRTGRWVTPPGVLDGPMISQFLYRDAPWSSQSIPARIRTTTPASEFLTDYDEWLRVQNGAAPGGRHRFDATRRFIANGRDLATYAITAPAVAWPAALLLGSPAFEADPSHGGLFPAARPALAGGNPYPRSRTQVADGGNFGLTYVQSLIAIGTSRVTRYSNWQKTWVHRVLRPEAYGALVHHRLAHGVQDYPVHDAVLGARAVERSRAKHGTHLLAHTYPEGAPMHSSYPGNAAAIGGFGATLLKAFFDETREFPNPVQPDPNDPTRLVPYAGPPLTVGGELNKLAVNYVMGRNWAGIHWRSDGSASLALAEEVAISMLREEKATYREMFDGFSFARFDGTRVTI
jgi:hypothetical protein